MSYLEQFFLIAGVHFLAVASPGPDFAIIIKQSVRYNRRIAIYTSLGIAAGIILHVTYSLVGIGLIIASDERLLTGLKYLAAAYFCYIAWHGLRAKKPSQQKLDSQESQKLAQNELLPSAKKAFLTGFLINGLNIKATLFFVSLFSVVVAPQTPIDIKMIYGFYMVIATGAWFIFLSFLLTQEKVRSLLQVKGYLVDRLMGAVLLLLAIQLVISDLN
ncbi:LysE family translocator [Litorilituus sediminis]|uniref:LysE family translocator n=1 Tax=Litorilituus sediminis TaxID=718192 RepID=A0A4P6P531_9GAMM|nr:LysE family transporter [Litorilituus sediminis]QBG34462.1 LysE family translocator [Litorilituus sediminis]